MAQFTALLFLTLPFGRSDCQQAASKGCNTCGYIILIKKISTSKHQQQAKNKKSGLQVCFFFHIKAGIRNSESRQFSLCRAYAPDFFSTHSEKSLEKASRNSSCAASIIVSSLGGKFSSGFFTCPAPLETRLSPSNTR